jgi:assimilatory nitrate reductase catalytic subunit
LAGLAGRAESAESAIALSSLQTQLRCGTNCGSCLPELKKAVREAARTGVESALP